MHPELSELKAGLYSAGHRPAPFAGILRFIRSFLWPIIRQYHFFQLENLVRVERSVDDVRQELAPLRSQLEGVSHDLSACREITQGASRNITAYREELEKHTAQQALWRSELSAIVQRQLLGEHQLRLLDVYCHQLASSLSSQIDNTLAELQRSSGQTLVAFQEQTSLDLQRAKTRLDQLTSLQDDLLAEIESLKNLLSAHRADLKSIEIKTSLIEKEQAALIKTLDNTLAETQISSAQTLAAFREQTSDHVQQVNTRLDQVTSGQEEIRAEIGALKTVQSTQRTDLCLIEQALEEACRRLDDLGNSTKAAELAYSEIHRNTGMMDSRLVSIEASYSAHQSALADNSLRVQEEAVVLKRIESTLETLTGALAITGEPDGGIRRRDQSNSAESPEGPSQVTPSEYSGLAASLRELEERGRISLVVVPNGLFAVKYGDLVCDQIRQRGEWDPAVMEIITRVGERCEGGVALDVGSHIGFMSIAMSRAFSLVHSFEPNGFTHKLLAANVTLNGCMNVTCHQVALYSRPGRLSLAPAAIQEIPIPLSNAGAFDGLSAPNLGAFSFSENGTGIFEVEARTLDSYGLSEVRLVKIDAQGADGEILFGARETIAASRPVVLFEWEQVLSSNFGVEFSQVNEFFVHLGYRVEVLHQTNEKQVDYVAWPEDRL